MASYLAMMAVGEFDVRAYRERGIDYWDAVDPRLYEPVGAAHRRPLRVLAVRRPRLQAARAHDQRAGRRRAADLLGDARHRADVGLLLRRGAPGRRPTTGRRCPTPTATRASRPATSARSGSSLHPFLEHYQTRHRRGLRPRGHDRRLARGERPERRLRAVDGSTCPSTPGKQIELSLTLRQPTTSSRCPACWSTTSSGPAARASTSFEVDGEHDGRLDRARRAGGQRAQPERLDRRHGRGSRRSRSARRSTRRSRSSRRSIAFLSSVVRAAIRSPRRAGSSTSHRSASRWRRRRGRSTRPRFFTERAVG